ncbi:MAG: DUF4177 domain-containing protein [Deltaproteobacteria bacterium]|nr:DUF4177 domain-containing protein [Deltaproteobacteria bacterium]MBW2658150.1 DUF4177 domain-containing protein [Deltaproteobacteria bacterium]
MRWSYKTVHYELKKEGLLGSAFLDESEVEVSLNEYGRAGWELISMIETMNGVIAVFKQPLFGDSSPLFQIDAERENPGGARPEKSSGSMAEEDDGLTEVEETGERKRETLIPGESETSEVDSVPDETEDDKPLVSDQGGVGSFRIE